MAMYDGYQIKCGCTCSKCGYPVALEGYSDAWGSHFCFNCNDYVSVVQHSCNARSEDKVARREAVIKQYGADKD